MMMNRDEVGQTQAGWQALGWPSAAAVSGDEGGSACQRAGAEERPGG